MISVSHVTVYDILFLDQDCRVHYFLRISSLFDGKKHTSISVFLSRVGVFTNHFFCGPLYILETRDIVCFVAIFIVLIVVNFSTLF